jgi:hypothetical protein
VLRLRHAYLQGVEAKLKGVELNAFYLQDYGDLSDKHLASS